MLRYKNISRSTRTYYGVTFKPGESRSVPGGISDPNFIRVSDSAKSVEQPTTGKPKSTDKPLIEKIKNNDKQGGKVDGTDSNK